jgi:hypothetical protein
VTSAELVSGLDLGLGLGSHFASHAPSHAPLFLATLLSHNISLDFPPRSLVVVRLVHTSLGSSYLIANVLNNLPPPRAHSFVLGTAVKNNSQPVTELIQDATVYARCSYET